MTEKKFSDLIQLMSNHTRNHTTTEKKKKSYLGPSLTSIDGNWTFYTDRYGPGEVYLGICWWLGMILDCLELPREDLNINLTSPASPDLSQPLFIQTTPLFAIVTLAFGVPEEAPKPSIFFTRSCPSVTSPKTTCFPSNHEVTTVVMKNCEPFLYYYCKLRPRRQKEEGDWRVRPSISHTKHERLWMLQLEILIAEFLSVDRFSTSSLYRSAQSSVLEIT
jgi:hypothetical protein